jgi:uncharacterized sulfatase
MLYWHFPHYGRMGLVSSIRMGDYKLIEHLDDGGVELYDLRNDLSETTNLADSQPERVAAMKEKLQAWRKEVDAQMPSPPSP